MIRDKHLAGCHRRLTASRQRFEVLADGVRPENAIWQPARGRWSVAECLEHLNVSLDLYEPKMREAIEDARARDLTGNGPWEHRTIAGRFLLWGLDPDAKRSIPAPRIFRPESSNALDFSGVCDRFRDRIDRVVRLAEGADGLALDEIRIPTPISQVFPVTLAEAFEIHARHIPRHLAQAEAVTGMPGYPA